MNFVLQVKVVYMHTCVHVHVYMYMYLIFIHGYRHNLQQYIYNNQVFDNICTNRLMLFLGGFASICVASCDIYFYLVLHFVISLVLCLKPTMYCVPFTMYMQQRALCVNIFYMYMYSMSQYSFEKISVKWCDTNFWKDGGLVFTYNSMQIYLYLYM